MKKVFILLFLILFPFSVNALENINLNSTNYVVYDKTDSKIILEKSKEEIKSIASLTKIMSVIVAIENIDNYNEKVTITQEMLDTVPYNAYKVGLNVNDSVTIKDLLYATLLESGADSVNSLAVHTSGSIPNFVLMMNNKAKELELYNTSFENPIGMDDENNYSSAEDLLKLLNYSLKNDLFREIFESNTYKLSNDIEVVDTVVTMGNKLGVSTKRIIGNKTGFTGDAGLTIAFNFISHNHEYYAVVLNCPIEELKDFKHVRDALTIIDYVDNNYKYKRIVEKNSIYKSINVINSIFKKYDVINNNEVIKLVPIDYDDNYKIVDTLPTSISNKLKKGDLLGKISYYYKDDLIYEESIFLEINSNSIIRTFINQHLIFIILEVILIGYIIYILRLIFSK